MAEQCAFYLKIWKEWQERAEEDSPSPEVREAVEHIASCAKCMAEVPELTLKLNFSLSERERKSGLPDFGEKKRQDGLSQAARTYPAVAVRLAQDAKLYNRFSILERAISCNFEKMKIPPEVIYTLDSVTQPREWVRLFARESGYTKLGKLKKQPRVSIELHLDMANKEVVFNLQPVLSLTNIPQARRGQPATNEFLPTIRLASKAKKNLTAILRFDRFKAEIVFEPQRQIIRIKVSKLPEYASRPPDLAILSESGSMINKSAIPTKNGYEAVFTINKTGNYLLAIDIIDESVHPVQGEITGETAGELSEEKERSSPRTIKNIPPEITG